jgi:hypothetical protein
MIRVQINRMEDEIVPPLVTQLGWTHPTLIRSKTRSSEERIFYLEALDRDVKKIHENLSIGLLLCKGKDNEVVEYALSRSLSPAMVSEYRLKMPDKSMLQAKLHELLALREFDEQEQT